MPSLYPLLLPFLFLPLLSVAQHPLPFQNLPNLPLRPIFPIRSPVSILSSCLPPGIHIHGITSPVQCPCQATLHTQSSQQSPQIHLQIHPHDKLSSNPLSLNQSGTLYIPDPSSFRLLLKSTLSSQFQDCHTRVTLSLTSLPSRNVCPVALPTELSRTNHNDDRALIKPRIVGGHEPHKSLRTHMVAFIQGNSFTCSGVAISAFYVLTAAHCQINTQYQAVLGGSVAGRGSFRSIEWVRVHPSFNHGREEEGYDIAVVKLREAAPGNQNEWARVNVNRSVPLDGSYVRAMGYGRTETKQGGPKLRQVDVPVVPMDKCISNYRRVNRPLANRLEEDLHLCAGLENGGCDACQGDSGGPALIFDKSGHLVVVGLVSFGIGCAQAGFPGVYTRVVGMVEWLSNLGVQLTPSDDGVAVFSAGSQAALNRGFRIGDLSHIQSILVVCAGAVVALSGILIGAGLLLKKNGKRPRGVEVEAYPVVVPGQVYGVSGQNFGGPYDGPYQGQHESPYGGQYSGPYGEYREQYGSPSGGDGHGTGSSPHNGGGNESGATIVYDPRQFETSQNAVGNNQATGVGQPSNGNDDVEAEAVNGEISPVLYPTNRELHNVR